MNRLLIPLAGLALILAGCGGKRANPTTAPESNTDAVTEQTRRLDEIERRLERLSGSLGGEQTGRGAYRGGPTLAIDRQGRSTMLEELHQLELQLADARIALEKRLAELEGQRNDLARATDEIERQSFTIEELKLYENRTRIARDALKAANERIGAIEAELQGSEHRRLEIERVFAEFAASFLKLRALDTEKINELQRELRSRIEQYKDTVKDTDDKDAGNAS